jgi:hypothetical protein
MNTLATNYQPYPRSQEQAAKPWEKTEWVPHLIVQGAIYPFGENTVESETIGDITFDSDGTLILGNQAFDDMDAIDFRFSGYHATRPLGGGQVLEVVSSQGEKTWFCFKCDLNWGTWYQLFPRTIKAGDSFLRRFRIFFGLIRQGLAFIIFLIVLGILFAIWDKYEVYTAERDTRNQILEALVPPVPEE